MPTTTPTAVFIHATQKIHANLESLLEEITEANQIATTEEIRTSGDMEKYLGVLCINLDGSFPYDFRFFGRNGFTVTSNGMFNLTLEPNSKVAIVASK